MPLTPEALLARVEDALGDKLVSSKIAVGEVTVEVKPEDWLEVATTLRDEPGLAFDLMMDLCGVDYSAYKDGAWEGDGVGSVYGTSIGLTILQLPYALVPIYQR